MSTSTTPKQSALDLIDSRPLTRNQKNLVAPVSYTHLRAHET